MGHASSKVIKTSDVLQDVSANIEHYVNNKTISGSSTAQIVIENSHNVKIDHAKLTSQLEMRLKSLDELKDNDEEKKTMTDNIISNLANKISGEAISVDVADIEKSLKRVFDKTRVIDHVIKRKMDYTSMAQIAVRNADFVTLNDIDITAKTDIELGDIAKSVTEEIKKDTQTVIDNTKTKDEISGLGDNISKMVDSATTSFAMMIVAPVVLLMIIVLSITLGKPENINTIAKVGTTAAQAYMTAETGIAPAFEMGANT